MEKEFFDLVVIGRGLAGLSAAAETPKNKNTAVFFRGKEFKANSFKAQGGIASAISENDSTEKHFNDSIKTGNGLSNKEAVKILVEKGKEKVLNLIEAGFEFDENQKGIDFALESGHSEKRILHSKGDNTGKELTKYYIKLAKEKNIHFFSEKKLTNLIIEKGLGKQAVFDDFTAEFNSIVFASGGYSNLYSKNTNPEASKGETLSIALKSGIHLMDLEFEQFHPTTIKNNNFLLSETLRGEGAFLINDLNEKFMKKIPGNSLATRDAASAEIFNQNQSGRQVFLDCTKIENFKERFPSIYLKLKEMKLNPELIEVEPAAHYSIGGIKIDLDTRTNIKNVFAAGECSCSGVHGANRLASNSLLETLVFGSIAGKQALKIKKNEKTKKEIKLSSLQKKENNSVQSDSEFNFSFLQKIMWDYVGIKKNRNGLEYALKEINKMSENNYTFLAEKIISSALNREESRGCHYRSDFKEKKREFEKHSIIEK
ncbi:MAG: L-aspartate oxidase [Candidatus Diapherotrites archaeon CG10_big_fil_rev_8_21_14_0_10_31_34]|nr:MAG: L-aspartate oxidase [Candidatus Diapherotrites archaeon CG10_big_fil_rev_8_21_14_0_10_31_34]